MSKSRYIIKHGSRAYPIPDFSGYYITKGGKIWSEKRKIVLRPGKYDKYGHSQVILYKDGHPVAKRVHRLILETFVGPCPDGMECCHNNGVAADNRLENLRWDTRSNNAKDGFRHGTKKKPFNLGEKHGQAKLNELQVRVIRRLLGFRGLTLKEIGAIFGVAGNTIYGIKSGKNWRWLC